MMWALAYSDSRELRAAFSRGPSARTSSKTAEKKIPARTVFPARAFHFMAFRFSASMRSTASISADGSSACSTSAGNDGHDGQCAERLSTGDLLDGVGFLGNGRHKGAHNSSWFLQTLRHGSFPYPAES